MNFVSVILQTFATTIFSIGGFFLGKYVSDLSDIELYKKNSECAHRLTRIPSDRAMVALVFKKAYEGQAEMWKNASEIKEKEARKSKYLGIVCLVLGFISLITSTYV